jgi:PIN domain nuclease of toxin-antitoxin system
VGRDEVIVADTHAWIWWSMERDRLSPTARAALATTAVAISSISMWEVAMLAHRSRILLDLPIGEWIEKALAGTKTVTLPITVPVAVTAGTFSYDVVRDPADRLIVATALAHGVPLVTKDERIRRAAVVETIW